jgi:L-alanine-DL-glutamate epimerase-like enolase superfamily enzyme
MTIRSAQAIPISIPYDIGGPKPTFAGIPRKMEILLIRLETETGMVGWGEAFGLSVWPATKQAFEHLIAPLIIGRDETDIPALINPLQRQLHILGRTGPVTFALSGLDIALWDLKGKRENQSLTELFGGQAHPSFSCYASLMRYGTVDLVKRNTEDALNKGFSAIKLHEVGVDKVQAARAVMDLAQPLMMDVNCPWDLPTTLDMIDQLLPSELYWLEEPIWPPEDFGKLAQVKRYGKMKIAAGENNLSLNHFEQMIEAQAVDFIQPSVTKIGGISEMLKIIALGKASNIPVMPHSPYFGPGLLATLHLATCLPEKPLIEYSFATLTNNPLGQAVLASHGEIALPTLPGLGCDPDEDIVRALTIPT